MMGVPLSSQDQEPLPVAAMCHSMIKAFTIDPSIEDHTTPYCHQMLGREFLVVPEDGLVTVDLEENELEAALDLEVPEDDEDVTRSLMNSRSGEQPEPEEDSKPDYVMSGKQRYVMSGK